MLFFCKEEKEKLTQVPFLKLPYNKIFLGIRNSAPKGFPGRSKRFFLRYFSSNWFKACFIKVTSTSKFLPSYSQALHWFCKTNELTLTLYGYLKYVKSIHRIRVHETANQSLPKEWTFLNGIWTELKLSFGATLPYTLENLVCITLRVFLLQRMLPLSSLVAFLFFLSFFLFFFHCLYHSFLCLSLMIIYIVMIILSFL